MEISETEMISATVEDEDMVYYIGNKQYELSNHLGNVLAVITDKKIPIESTVTSGEVGYYEPEIVTAMDYSPFGVVLEDRKFESDAYRYGFQGQEKDDEIKGEGNSVNYKYRMHDPRLGRFFAVDPLVNDYPWNSPYAFSENSTIAFVELEGLEKVFVAYESYEVNYATGIDKRSDIMIMADLNSMIVGVLFNTKVINLNASSLKNALVSQENLGAHYDLKTGGVNVSSNPKSVSENVGSLHETPLLITSKSVLFPIIAGTAAAKITDGQFDAQFKIIQEKAKEYGLDIDLESLKTLSVDALLNMRDFIEVNGFKLTISLGSSSNIEIKSVFNEKNKIINKAFKTDITITLSKTTTEDKVVDGQSVEKKDRITIGVKFQTEVETDATTN